jgi:hypothetical protein
MKLPRRSFLHLAAGAAFLPVVSGVARAQAYPTRPVRIVVGVAAGSTPDILAPLGQPIGPVVARAGRTGPCAAKPQSDSEQFRPTSRTCPPPWGSLSLP